MAPSAATISAREDLLRQIRLRLQAEVMIAFDSLLDITDPDQLRAKVDAIVDRVITVHGYAVTHDEREHLAEELVGEVGGLGPLDPLLLDESITEIMVNGPRHLYIERGGKISRVDSYFLNDEHVLRIIDRIITPLGRRIDASSPRVDARLPDGSRVNAVIEPLSLVGPVITVRKFPAKPITVDDLIRFGTATPEMFEFLRVLRRGTSQRLRLRRHRLREDHDPQRPVVVHPRGRADRHDRGCRRAAAQPGARREARGPPAEPRRQGRDHHPRPAAQRPAHAS